MPLAVKKLLKPTVIGESRQAIETGLCGDRPSRNIQFVGLFAKRG